MKNTHFRRRNKPLEHEPPGGQFGQFIPKGGLCAQFHATDASRSSRFVFLYQSLFGCFVHLAAGVAFNSAQIEERDVAVRSSNPGVAQDFIFKIIRHSGSAQSASLKRRRSCTKHQW